MKRASLALLDTSADKSSPTAVALQNAAQVVEHPADVQVGNIDVPVLVRRQRLLKRFLAPSLSRPVEGLPILSHPPAGGLRRSTDGA
jgi:hypothetical protein